MYNYFALGLVGQWHLPNIHRKPAVLQYISNFYNEDPAELYHLEYLTIAFHDLHYYLRQHRISLKSEANFSLYNVQKNVPNPSRSSIAMPALEIWPAAISMCPRSAAFVDPRSDFGTCPPVRNAAPRTPPSNSVAFPPLSGAFRPAASVTEPCGIFGLLGKDFQGKPPLSVLSKLIKMKFYKTSFSMDSGTKTIRLLSQIPQHFEFFDE